MEHEVKLLMLGTILTSSGALQKLRGWTKILRLLRLGKEIRSFTITLRVRTRLLIALDAQKAADATHR